MKQDTRIKESLPPESDITDNAPADGSTTSARGLPEAAASGNSLLGYAAINGLADQDSIAQLAYDFYQNRQRDGISGEPEDDWFRAELELRERTNELNGKS